MSNERQLGFFRKDVGLDVTEEANANWVNEARNEARRVAKTRGNRTATADDVRDWAIKENKFPGSDHAWGAIFRNSEWMAMGRTHSRHASNNARQINVWRLR